MNSLIFWSDWSKEHKIIYLLLGLLFLSAVVYFLFSLIVGADAVLAWESLMQSEAIETTMKTISQPPFALPLNVESYVFLDYFNGSSLRINQTAYYIFIVFFGIGLTFILTVITYLPRFWYMVAIGLFVVLVIFFKLELILLFNSNSKIALILVLALYLPASFYFQSFNKNVSLSWRLISFGLITTVLAILIGTTSGVDLPFMQLAIYGMPALLIVAIIFNLLVSHDIVAGFLNAVSSGATSVGNWRHFFFITGIYLVNILILYLNEIQVITWDVIPLNVFILLLISALVGIWGYKQREPQYIYLYPFNPIGAIFYLTLAMLSFSTIAFFYATGNDPVLDVIHDIIIYSHLGYGFVFIMYIASNYLKLMTKGFPVTRILYKPTVMPYFTYRFAGIIAFGALLFLQNWELPVEKTFAGYYNGLGDLHTLKEDYVLANGYYLQGSQYGYSNHRSNYSLATNALEEGDIEKAIDHLNRSNFSWPTEYSYINISNIYIGGDRYFDALFSLNEGLRKFPDSGPIMNNLGLLYSKIDVFDSAVYYLEESYSRSISQDKARNNLLAILAKKKSAIDLSNQEWLINDSDPINTANAYAAYNSVNKPYKSDYPGELVGLNQFIHTGVYNFLINDIWRTDTTSFSVVDKIYGSNMLLDRRLNVGKAFNYYNDGNIIKAIEEVNPVRMGDLFWTGDMHYLLGLWNLDNGEWKYAQEFMTIARENYNRDSHAGLAIAQTLAGNRLEAISTWDSVKNITGNKFQLLANDILPILKETDINVVREWDDAAKYQWLQFHELSEEINLRELIKDDNYLAAIYLKMTQDLIQEDKLDEALSTIAKADGLKLTDQELGNALTATFMEIAALQLDVQTIASILDEGFEINDPIDKDHYQALMAWASGDTINANMLFSKWEYMNPYKVSFALSASHYYESLGNYQKAYQWLQKTASLNANSIALQKNYVRMCGQLGYESFGRYVLDLIREIMGKEEFTILETQFEKDIEAWNKSDF